MSFAGTDLFPLLFAGLINGSFVIPARYVKNLTAEKTWLYHSVLGLAILPWILLLLLSPHSLHNYLLLQPGNLLLLILGGVIFGLGQVCFIYAIERIGIALSFTINLGIGVTIGSMFVVFERGVFLTTAGELVTLAVFLILISLILYYVAGKNRLEDQFTSYQHNAFYRIGWLLASIAGCASGFQNIVFIIVMQHTEALVKAGSSFWIWPPFLFAAAIPMALNFIYRIQRNKLKNSDAIDSFNVAKNIFLITLMGVCFTGSLALYSSGMNQLTLEQQIIGWPLFMVSIILTSQAWGWLYKESSVTALQSKLYKLCSIILLITAIFILAFSKQ